MISISLANPATGAGTLLWQFDLAEGEKVWSAPTVVAGQIIFPTATGNMESSDPRSDTGDGGTGNLYSRKLNDGTETWTLTDIGKIRGSLYVDSNHAYLTTIDNKILRFGDGNYGGGTPPNNVILKAWRER